MLGIAMVRDLVRPEHLEGALRAAPANPCEILEELELRGILDGEDLEILRRLAGEAESEPTSAGGDTGALPVPSGAPISGSAPPSGGGTGTRILRQLSQSAWGPYRNLRFIGEGGMGRIFKAYDPVLKRTVALKFLRHGDPALVQRFMLEAQHQARVEHPNIAKVYAVGEWEGQPYLAMQFIRGETLEALGGKLGLEAKLRLMERVAEAVHAAHRQGLIHRDLKPANIMVEREGEGWTPFVLDFGLARGVESSGMTLQGAVMGTLHYMAPEQARGEQGLIGRGTDVYGLGATLHCLLTGKAPFAEGQGLDAARLTLEEELPSLRHLNPELPEDLDLLVQKCMEKEPAQRYGNALEVAEELRRWLGGEPLRAHRPSRSYRLSKWVRRRRALVAVAGAALGMLLLLGGAALKGRLDLRRQAGHAQHFGQEAERIEALLRYGHLLPPHDIRVERAQARERLEALRQEASRAGALAAGPSAYALGRGHLALGACYRLERDRSRRLANPEQRAARLKELDRTLREQALARLREGGAAALESPAFHQAQMELYAGRFEAARVRAREALERSPWLFEAKRLEGEATLEEALAQAEPKAALRLLASAATALEAAQALGPSDPETALAGLRVQTERSRAERLAGEEGREALTRCRAAFDRALRLDPGNALAPAYLAQALSAWANLRAAELPEAQAAMAEALGLSEAALERAPESAEVQAIRVGVVLGQGFRLKRNDAETLGVFRQAQQLARTGCQRHPGDPVFPALLVEACRYCMTQEMHLGLSPWVSFEEGLAQARGALARHPELPSSYGPLVALWIERAEYERTHGLDPQPSVAWALRVLAWLGDRGLPERIHWNRADALLVRGQFRVRQGLEGLPDLEAAAEGYRAARRANPNRIQAATSIAEAQIWAAEARLLQGQSPEANLAAARAELQAEGPFPSDRAETCFQQACLALMEGRVREGRGGDPAPDWARAEAALRLDPARAEAWLWVAFAEREAQRRGDAEAEARCQAARKRALDLDANLRWMVSKLGLG